MWFTIKGSLVELYIIAKPNAKKSAVTGVSDQALHIAIHAKSYQGEANKELISYLSKLFELPKSKILLQRGDSSRYKKIILPLSMELKGIIDKLDLNGRSIACFLK